MDNEFGIESLKSFGEFLIDSGDLSGKVWEDKRIDFKDIPHAMALPGIVSKAKNSKDVIKEAFDMTDQEADDFESHIKAYAATKKGDIPNEKLEEIVEDLLLAIPALARVWMNFQ